ncbi:MAG: hypothetical protein GXP56_14280 [Deltaproteobacteria bacterium]|nr:hypothetical protein [Deltaproteobacteria bacterium]
MCANIILRQFDMIILSLKEIVKFGKPQLPDFKLSALGKSNAITVLPRIKSDKTFYKGVSAEIYLKKKNDHESVYRPSDSGKLALILAAGNQSLLIFSDILDCLFIKNQPAAVKMNPVNDYLTPILERVFKPLIREKFISFIKGDASIGSYLSCHEKIKTLHLTGSDKTYDTIVFGGKIQHENAEDRIPVNNRPFSAELGNITPVTVVPGQWSFDELYRQVIHVANMMVNNASFNCITARLLIVHDQWAQREKFLEMLKGYLSTRQANYSYYPNSDVIYAKFLSAYPEAEKLCKERDGYLPWTFISGLNWQNKDEIIYNSEPYCPIMGEVSIPGNDIPAFPILKIHEAYDAQGSGKYHGDYK